MKHKKQIIMILLVAFLLVGLGTLAAADVTKNDTSTNKNTEKNTKISTENNIKDTTKTQTTQTPITKEKQIQKTQKLNTKKEPTPINITTYDDLQKELKFGIERTKILNITQNITLEGSPTLTGSITNLIINGNQKTINGNGTYQFLSLNRGQTVTINNITITNCKANNGGAIYTYGGTLNINNTNLTGNNAKYGGAIVNDNEGTLNINNTNLTGNNARNFGGAIANYYGGTLNITHSNLTQNNANDGGASATSNSLFLI